jgi:hypothetical protein
MGEPLGLAPGGWQIAVADAVGEFFGQRSNKPSESRTNPPQELEQINKYCGRVCRPSVSDGMASRRIEDGRRQTPDNNLRRRVGYDISSSALAALGGSHPKPPALPEVYDSRIRNRHKVLS